jgi:parvulin-like peptidyl-prolyl isomerase
LFGFVVLAAAGLAAAQTPPPAQVDVPPSRDAVAASVNGQAIPELAVYRSLSRLAPEKREAKRKEVLDYLIDNAIIDQYLLQLPQLKNAVDAKEVEKYIEAVKKEAIDSKQDFKQILVKMMVTEDELRSELTSALRWDKFVLLVGTDKVLEDYFKANVEMFNGSRLHARHILVKVEDGKKEQALAAIGTIKTKIETDVNLAVAKLPPATPAIKREEERAQALAKAFADAAAKQSACPSSKEGGDLGFFPRAGAMVEPFAQAAFALKPYQMSNPVATEFGFHLILAVEYKPGKDVKFEQVKPFVQEVYGERLRERVLADYKAKSRIEIMEAKKKS